MSTTTLGPEQGIRPRATRAWFAMNSLVRDNATASRARITALIDMPFSRFRALRRIAVADTSQRVLAERLGIDAPAMSGIIADLVERGLVDRRPHETDGRCKVVTITESGRAAVAAVVDDPASEPPMFAALDDDELAELDRLLEKLRTAADA